MDVGDDRPRLLLRRLRLAGDPLSIEAAVFIEEVSHLVSVNEMRRARAAARRRAQEETEQSLAIAARNRGQFKREARAVLEEEAARFDMDVEKFLGTRGSFKWEGVYRCWQIAAKYNISRSDLARFLKMDRATINHTVQKMKAAGQISESGLASRPGSALSGTSHHGVSTSEGNIDT